MRTGKDRVEVSGMNVPVSTGNAQVRPGAILEAAAEAEKAEQAILEMIRGGSRLDEARKQFAYHQLQSKH